MDQIQHTAKIFMTMNLNVVVDCFFFFALLVGQNKNKFHAMNARSKRFEIADTLSSNWLCYDDYSRNIDCAN